jgi:flagellar FliJ protein
MFRFRLESVLNARRAHEDKLLREFSEISRDLEKAKQVLEALIAERMESIDRLKRIHDQTVAAAEIGMYTSYIDALHSRVKHQQRVVAKVQEVLEAKRQEVLEAVKNRKIMENLKERHRLEYETSRDHKERVALDEISLQGFSRRLP